MLAITCQVFGIIGTNHFVAIIIKAMQIYQDAEHGKAVQALHHTQDHIEGKLRAEMQPLGAEMAELRKLLGRQTSTGPARED